MSDRPTPDLSVVVVTDHRRTIRKTTTHLQAQTVRDRLELVIVAPSADRIDLRAGEFQGFLKVRVVEVGEIIPLSRARGAGVRQASSPLVVFVESHSYPDPSWAAALIEAHRHPWAVVGPAMGNANPGSMISWANLFLDYGPWVEPVTARVVDHLPGHNSSYKRAILLGYGPELETMLDAETVLHWDLRARGYRLYLEAKARTAHLNVSRLSSWIPERFYGGRRFAAARARRWSPLRRLLYTGGAPLIPVVRLPRILRDIRRSGRQVELLPMVLPSLIMGLLVSAAGEMVGYAFGEGKSMAWLSRLELHKVLHLTERESHAEIADRHSSVSAAGGDPT